MNIEFSDILECDDVKCLCDISVVKYVVDEGEGKSRPCRPLWGHSRSQPPMGGQQAMAQSSCNSAWDVSVTPDRVYRLDFLPATLKLLCRTKKAKCAKLSIFKLANVETRLEPR